MNTPGEPKSNPACVHPYIPNSAPAVKAEMLRVTGAGSIAEFYADIPAALRLDRPLDLPAPFRSEHRLKCHVESLLAANVPTSEVLSFLGGGCYQHHVPAVCDEINGRSEFLTAYAGEPYDDAGRFQALFEYAHDPLDAAGWLTDPAFNTADWVLPGKKVGSLSQFPSCLRST
mgnify:CR=1 FL=1